MAQKKQKYDRQLRIWGEHGQAALQGASICLLNCGPTGSETLKNLVLGGIGSFTVIDGSRVEPADLGNNYFVDHDNLGQPKAKVVTALLQELNESAAALFVDESPEALLDSNPSFFKDFSLVVATQLAEAPLLKLEETCRQYGVMLLVARSYGLTGLLRCSLKEHLVTESKPDNVIEDLRLHNPWPELKAYCDDFDVDTKDLLSHKHIPYAVILYKVCEAWKAAHDGKLPSTSSQRSEFKAQIASHKKEEDEDNYREALAAAYRVWSPPGVSTELQSVLDDRATEQMTQSTPDFWVLVAALKEYVANEGRGELPLEGGIPDMTSFTESYVGLQKVYLEKASSDAAAVHSHVQKILKRLGRDPQSISLATIRFFCKNARNLRVVRYRTLAEEYGTRTANKAELVRLLGTENSSHAALYLLIRAADHFKSRHNRYPGVFDSELEEDVSRLKTVALGLLNEPGASGVAIPDDYVGEMCRYGAGEPHCTAAVIGGIAAQEAIKLITKQFVPVSGTLVYNAMASSTAVLAL